MEISEEIDSNELLTRDNIKSLLLLLAFTTPFLITFVRGLGFVNIILSAPVWTFGTMDYPIFRFNTWEMIIMELPFGLFSLAFIHQVLLFKKNLTDSGKLVIVGIFCELPGLILSYMAGVPFPSLPFPLFLIIGLLLAKYTTKDPISWIEKKSNA